MSDASEWLIGTAKRNPEALLVLAAGAALLLRSRGSTSLSARSDISNLPGTASSAASRVAETASGVVTDLKDRITDAGSAVAGQAGELSKSVTTQTSQIASKTQSMVTTGFGQLVQEQPLALVALGLAAGAAVAALLPATDIEERTLGGARDAIADMSGKVGENLMAAAGDAGRRLTQEMSERAEDLKELAKDVAGQFTDKLTGSADKPELAGNAANPANRTS